MTTSPNNKRRYRTALPLVASASSLLWACGDGRDNTISRRTALVQYQSCSQLEADLKSQLIAHGDALIDSWTNSDFGSLPPSPEPTAPENDASGDGGGRQEGSDYSGTNNQEDGVDEGDFVKTDGYHIYTLVSEAHAPSLRIMGVPEFGQLVDEATLPIEGYPRELLLGENTAVVLSTVYTYDVAPDSGLRGLIGATAEDGSWVPHSYALTKVTLVDITDRTAPAVTKEFYVDGDLQMSRRIEQSVRFATYAGLNVYPLWNYWSYLGEDNNVAAARAAMHAAISALPLAQLLPGQYLKEGDTFSRAPITEALCRSYYSPTNSAGYGVSSVYSFDFANSDELDQDSIVSNYGTFYASKDQLVLADFAYDWWFFDGDEPPQELLNIHTFDISTPGETTYLGSGRVDGYLVNQFSMDEHEGKIRVATSTGVFGQWWGNNPTVPESHIFILEKQGDEFVQVGHLGGLAPGEQLFSARFLDDKAYLVTFQQIDPLFTIDLSNPVAPTVIGELKIPGVSTYIHPISDDHLLTIGIGGDESGADWWNTTVSMFDVSDFADPTLQDSQSLALDDTWYAYSEARWDHKAFQYFAPKKLLSVPLEGSQYLEGPDYNNDGYGDYYIYNYKSELVLINVDEATGLSIRGSIDHSSYYETSPCYWSPGVRRTIFMGDYIYAISGRVITVSKTSDLSLVTSELLAPMPPTNESGCYWYGEG